MIKKIFQHHIHFGKLVFRNPFHLLSLILGVLYLGLIIYAYTSTDISNPANMLQLSTYLVQGGMLIFMFLGYFSINSIYSNPIFDLYKNRISTIKIQLVSNITFTMLLNFFFCLFSLILFLITYKLYGYSFSELYVDSSYFILLYWFAPFAISSLIGMVLGFWVNQKISILIIIVLWFFVSPMNVYFLDSFFSLLGVDFFPDFLRLGVDDPRMPYNAFSGFLLPMDNILLKLTWISFLVTLVSLCSLKETKKSLTYVLVTFVLILSLIPFTVLQKNDLPEKEQHMNELKYYDAYDSKVASYPELKFDYKIKSYDIDLNVDEHLTATVGIEFSTPIQGSKGFSLYHGFRVKSVVNNKNEEMSFKQDKDLLRVDIATKTKKILVEYEGESSVFMAANKDNIYLPFYFPWIPMNSKEPSMKSINFSNHRLPNQPDRNTHYTLHYTGPQPIITNLEKQDNILYSGSENKGIFVLHGDLDSNKLNNHKLTYPLTWDNAVKKSENYIPELEKSFNYINDIFDLGLSLPKDIFIVPSSGPNDFLYSEYMWIHPDGLFILYDPYEFFPDHKLRSLSYQSSYKLLGAMLWKEKEIVYQDYSNSILFTLIAGKYINKQISIEEPLGAETTYYLEDLFLNNKEFQEKPEKVIVDNVIKYVNTSDKAAVEEFLYRWWKLLESPDVTWSELQGLLDEVTR